MNAMKKFSLEEVLGGIEDTRRTNSVMYPLYDVLFIMIIAIICGATSYSKIEMFGKNRMEWLKNTSDLKTAYPMPTHFGM